MEIAVTAIPDKTKLQKSKVQTDQSWQASGTKPQVQYKAHGLLLAMATLYDRAARLLHVNVGRLHHM